MKNFFKLNSLRKKLSLWLTLIFLVIFSVFAFILIHNNMTATRENLTQEARAFSELSTRPIVESYELYFNSGFYKFKEIIDGTLALDQSIRKIQIVDTNGNIVFDSLEVTNSDNKQLSVDQATLDKVSSAEKSEIINAKNSNQIDQIIFPYFDDWGGHHFSVIYFISYDLVSQNAARLGNIIIWLASMFLLFGIWVLYSVVTRFIVWPVEKLKDEAETISTGQYNHKITLDTNDEIEDLAQSTNKMAETLAADIQKLKELDKLKDEFIDIAAHNFGTPVTHIRFDLDFLKSKLREKINEKEFHFLEDIEVSNENLNLLIQDLLNITTLQKGEMKLVKFLPFNLKTTITEQVVFYKLNAAKKKQNITENYNNIKEAEVLGDAPKIREVIGNILDNAVKFTKEEGVINIELQNTSKDWVVMIEDNGIGIPKEEIGKIFEKFHRATNLMTYDYPGEGLGLYISKLIIEAHNGRVWVDSEEGKGSRFYFSLPKNIKGSLLPKTVGVEK